MGPRIKSVKWHQCCAFTEYKELMIFYVIIPWLGKFWFIFLWTSFQYWSENCKHKGTTKGTNRMILYYYHLYNQSLWNSASYCINLWCSLTHWGQVMHICVSNQTIISLDKGLLPGRRQGIIWINHEISLIGSLETNFTENWNKIHILSFTKMHLTISSAKCVNFVSA